MSRTSPSHRHPLSRRELLRCAGLGLAGSALINAKAAAATADPAKSTSVAAKAPPASLEPLNRFGRMIHEHIVDQVRSAEDAANRRRAALRTKDDAEAYVREVREKIQQSFGAWPGKTPLNARVTRRHPRLAVRVASLGRRRVA